MLSCEPVLAHYYARFWNTSLLQMLYLVMHGPNNNVLMHGCTLMKWWLEENFLKPKSSKLWAWTMPVLAHRILLDNSWWTTQLSYDFFNQRYQADGAASERQRSGRPRKTDEREKRYLRRLARANPTLTARRLRDQWPVYGPISIRTVTWSLNRGGVKARRPIKRPLLTPRHKRLLSENFWFISLKE